MDYMSFDKYNLSEQIKRLNKIEDVIEYITNYKFSYRLYDTHQELKNLVSIGDYVLIDCKEETESIFKHYNEYNQFMDNVINNFRFKINILNDKSKEITISVDRTFVADLNLFLKKCYEDENIQFYNIDWNNSYTEFCFLSVKDSELAKLFLMSFFKIHSNSCNLGNEINVTFNNINQALVNYKEFEKTVFKYIMQKHKLESKLYNIFDGFIAGSIDKSPISGNLLWNFVKELANSIIYSKESDFNKSISFITKIIDKEIIKKDFTEKLTLIYNDCNHNCKCKKGYIYAVFMESYAKIGRTSRNLEIRLNALFPTFLKKYKQFNNVGMQVKEIHIAEKAFKCIYDDKKIKGEIFNLSQKEVEDFFENYKEIEKCLEKNFYPVTLSYFYQ